MHLKHFNILLIIMLLFTIVKNAEGQTVIPLYDGPIPNSKPTPDLESSETSDGILRIAKISRPTLTVYTPEKPNGTAIIICPGGGYWIEAAGHEGADVARKFNEAGITAFVLKYRIPDTATMINKEIGPLQDGQRAIQLVREQARKFHIKKNRIGLMGFSAGGHLAATAGTHFKTNYIDNPRNTSLRPDFLILAYPVVSFTDSIGHIGSREQLIGKNPSQKKILEYSNELHVTNETPPSFLVQAKDDGVKVQNSIYFADALKAHNVPVEIYLYEHGGHGYGMINKTSTVKWMDLVEEWMRKMGFVR